MPKTKFGEPWSAAAKRSAAYEDPFPPGTDVGLDPDAVSQARDAAKRCAERAEWLLWAADVHEPDTATGLVSGVSVEFDDRGIVGRFKAGDHAKRAAECVNAMQGVANPASWVASAKALLCEIVLMSDEEALCLPDGGQSRALVLLAALPATYQESEEADCKTPSKPRKR